MISQLRFAPPFSNHAVLQRDRPIAVWGSAPPAKVVIVRLADSAARVTAGPDGSWLVRLPALPAGGPHELVANADGDEIRIIDVLIGEVWIASGQSNMEWELNQTSQGLSETESNLPGIRVLTVHTPARLGRQTELDGRWTPATQKSLAGFSAVAGWFAVTLHRELGVPIGLICNAWGGTRLQAWMSREALVQDPDGLSEVSAYEQLAFAPPGTASDQLLPADWDDESLRLDACNEGLESGWAAPEFDDGHWATMTLPARWQDHGHAENGVFWFRRRATIPTAWQGCELVLNLGAIDKHDDTYVEGERVGGLSWEDGDNTWCTPRVYRVPAHLVKGDALQIAVRARSHFHHGGLIGPAASMSVLFEGDPASSVALAGEWRYAREQDWGVRTPPAIGPGSPNSPYTLFDSRLAPLIPYGLRGVIWYQGESNVDEAALYRRMLPQLVRDWRRAFGQGSFPFIQVQLANYMQPNPEPGPSAWAELREAQAKALAEPGVGLVATIDVGDANDIHPRNKRPVGERLARWALVQTYGHEGDPCGPIFAGLTQEVGGRVRVAFTHAAGLRTRDGAAPAHVALAGEGRVFHWAEARIEGECLIAWSERVPEPVAVRYAWANNPEGCNLVGGTASLPAAPFRSDDW
jgi:sialate O-acetylesterase